MPKIKMLCFCGFVAYRKCPEGSIASWNKMSPPEGGAMLAENGEPGTVERTPVAELMENAEIVPSPVLDVYKNFVLESETMLLGANPV